MGGGQSAAREGFDFVVEVERELKSSILEDKGVSYIHSGRFMKGMKKHKKILHKKDLKHIKEYLDMRPQPPVRLFKFRLARALTEKLPIKTIEEMELADARTRWVVVMLLGYCIEQPTLFHTLKFIASCLGTKDEGLEGQLLWRALYQSKSIREFHDGYPSFVNPSRVVRFLKSITRYPPSRVVPINEALFLLVEVFIARLSTILLLDICLFNHLSNVIASDILEADSNPKHAKLGVASVEAVRQTIRLGEYNIPDNVRKDILDELSLSGDVVPFSQFLPVIVEAVLRARATKLIQVDTSAQEQTMFWNRLTLVSFLRKLSSLPAWFAERFGEDIHAPQLTRDRFVQVLNELRTSTNFRISDEEIQGMWSALHWAAETPATTSIAFGHMVVTHLYTVALVRLRSNLSMFGYTLPLPPERSTWRTVDSAIPEVDMTTLTDMLITTHPFNANIHERSHAMRGSHKLFPQYLHTRTPVVHEAIKPLDCNQQNIAYAFQFDIRQLMRLMGHELPEYMSLYADPLSGLVPPIHPNNNNNNNANNSTPSETMDPPAQTNNNHNTTNNNHHNNNNTINGKAGLTRSMSASSRGSGVENGGTGNTEELRMVKQELSQLQENIREGEQMRQLERRQTEVLKTQIRELQRELERSTHTANLEYLKNVVAQYIEMGTEHHTRLFPVLATLLQFSPEEMARIDAAIASRTTSRNRFWPLG
eukprot:c16270_g2_i1.p1 GENE.c16270_g2_i1~~c16270_g2_i1.p1  ORF type:complete len:723 (-),score=189.42 c16270_g2_i1:182-2305(-)